LLRVQVHATGLGAVDVDCDQYCASYGDRQTRRLIESRPDIILIDMEDTQAALQTLNVLHAALPDTWLFVSSDSSDPQLIIETMRAGAREFLPKPIPPRVLSQALGRYVAERQRRRETRGIGAIYSVTAAKGGAGATSVAINIATSLGAMANTKVALIDLNSPVGDVAAHLNLKPQFTVSDALAAAPRLDSVLLESFVSHAHGIAVLPGPKEFQPEQAFSLEAMARMLEVVARTYTHSIVDLPASLEKDQLQLVTRMASKVVVVSVPELPALWRTERLIRFLAAQGDPDKLRLVINRSLKTDEISDRDIERVLKLHVYWKLPNNYKSAIRAINSGSPLVAANHSDLARGYHDLATALAGLPRAKKKKGLMGIFGSN
jgi:pilus assembly protein CpaE